VGKLAASCSSDKSRSTAVAGFGDLEAWAAYSPSAAVLAWKVFKTNPTSLQTPSPGQSVMGEVLSFFISRKLILSSF
jgi:hypothetical protein